MKHALFVAFHYPPEASSSGVLRTLKYTRYLGSHGWRATVLTLNRAAYPVQDPGLERQIPLGTRVIRTRFLDIKRHFSIRGVYPGFLSVPDSWIGWWPWAVRAGHRLMHSDPVDVVYSTSPHATAHLIALSLVRGSTLPWVTDFRDPWFEEVPEPGTPRLVHAAARRLERMVVRRADHVVASTARLRDVMAARYEGEPGEKFSAIANGFDEDDFCDLGSVPKEPAQEMLIVYAGSVNQTFRDPRPVFRAIREAADAGTLEPTKIRLRFFGAGAYGDSPEIQRSIHETGLARQVEFRPRVEYGRALAEMRRADVLLLVQASPDTTDLVPAKLFEYLRIGCPVLAVASPGATAEVIREVGGGWSVDPTQRPALRDALVAAYQAWRAGTLAATAANPRKLDRFSRRHLASELASRFESLCGATGR